MINQSTEVKNYLNISKRMRVRDKQTIEKIHPMYVTSSRALSSILLEEIPPVGLIYYTCTKVNFINDFRFKIYILH